MNLFEGALELAKSLGEPISVLDVQLSMGYTAVSQGDLLRARELAEAIFADVHVGGEPLMIGAALELQAWIALAADDMDGAAARLAEAWRAVGEVPPWAEAIRTNLLIDEAVLAYRRGDLARSATMVSEWLPHARASHSSQDLLLALLLFASIGSQFGQFAESARWFGALYAALTEGEHWLHQQPAIRSWHEADLARVREALGDEGWNRAWTVGSRQSLDVALAEAEEVIRSQVGVSEPGVPMGR
jgi:hypothetical protein